MNLQSLNKKTLLLLGGLLLICIFFIILAVSLLWQPKPIQQIGQNGPTPTPGFFESLFSSDLRITTLSPNPEILLFPETTPIFSVTFNKEVRLDNISVSLTEYILLTDQKNQIKITLSQEQSNTTVVITPTTPLKPYSSYTLSISQKSPSKRLLSESYQTQTPVPTPLPSNNEQLRQYLPYETGTYALSYLENQNMYVFNFLYNPADPTDIQTQYDQAKKNALLYIQSKGIDPDTVTVDWRWH